MILKTMPQSEIFSMRQKYKDTLIDAHNKQQEFLKNVKCLKCNSETQSRVNPVMPFSKNKVLPNIISKCVECAFEFDPYTDK